LGRATQKAVRRTKKQAKVSETVPGRQKKHAPKNGDGTTKKCNRGGRKALIGTCFGNTRGKNEEHRGKQRAKCGGVGSGNCGGVKGEIPPRSVKRQ